jgi:hypothetical protein
MSGYHYRLLKSKLKDKPVGRLILNANRDLVVSGNPLRGVPETTDII